MHTVLLATDADWLLDEFEAAIAGPELTLFRVRNGRDVRPAVTELRPDLVVLDAQIGSMGGIATALDLRMEMNDDETADVSIVMLLDREVDRVLANSVDADGFLVKPLDPISAGAEIRKILLEASGDQTRTDTLNV